MESELVGDLRRVHGVGQVLLVGEDQQHRLAKLVLGQHPHQLVSGCYRTERIIYFLHGVLELL